MANALSTYKSAVVMGPALGVSYRRGLTLILLQLAAIVFEGIGITALLPIVQFIQNHGDINKLMETARYWRWIVNAHQAVGFSVTLIGLILSSFAAIVARQIFGFLRTYFDGRIQEYAVQQVRIEGFRRFIRADQASQDETRVGEIVNDLIVEAPRAISAIVCVTRVAGATLLISVYVGILALLSVWLTVGAFVVLVIGLIVIRGLLGRSRDTSVNITAMNKRLSAFLSERLRAGRLIRLSGSEDAEVHQLRVLTGKQTARLYHMHRINATIGATMEPIAVGIALALLYFGTQYFGISIETIGLFAIILIRLLPAVTEGIRMHNVVLSYSGSLDAVMDRLTRLQSAREPNQGTVLFEGLNARIVFDNVSYVYANSEDVPALRNVSLEIPAHKMTAIVGHSGAGKSTFVDLLPRVRLPTDGRILIDGRPLNEFTLASLRQRIAFVSQAPQIFDLPVWQQISYGNDEIGRDAIERAARLAGAADFIEALPQGYDTMLGEGGVRLSGGERQRLDVARALARHASILILDEPTSQLDPESEQKFRATLQLLRQETDLTIIVIAHRFSTIVDADQIIVLEGGRVTGVGTHAQLQRSCAWYRNAQQSNDPGSNAKLQAEKVMS